MVIGIREWSRRGPNLVQVGNNVVRISGKSCIEFGNWYVSDLQLLPSLCFICLEYLIERLF